MFSNYILFVIGIIIVIVALLLLRKEFYRKSNDHHSLYDKENEILKNIEVAEDIIKELNDIGDSLINKLDEKIIEINQLLHKVDETIDLLCSKTPIFNTCEIEEVKNETLSIVGTAKIEHQDQKNELEANKEIEKVIELTNKGYPPSQVAKFLNKGIGEINLILNLKKR